MIKIDEMSCVEKLNSKGLSYILDGILECIDKKIISEEEAKALKSIENDYRVIAGRKISSLASAALDVLNVKDYMGTDEDVIGLTEAWRKNGNWANYTLKEAPFWREGMTPEEYDIEREYYGKNYDLVRKGKYVPLWKQNKE